MHAPFNESKLWLLLSALFDLIYSGILWLICSIPVVTLGPASAALYYTVVKTVRHERGGVTASFFKSFRDNLKTGIIIWLIFLLVFALWAGNIFAVDFLEDRMSPILALIWKFLPLPVLLMLPWAFPYISRFENPVGHSLRYIAHLCFSHPLRSVALTLVLAGGALIIWIMPQMLLLLPGILCLLMSYIIEPVFKAITIERDDENEDPWYNE